MRAITLATSISYFLSPAHPGDLCAEEVLVYGLALRNEHDHQHTGTKMREYNDREGKSIGGSARELSTQAELLGVGVREALRTRHAQVESKMRLRPSTPASLPCTLMQYAHALTYLVDSFFCEQFLKYLKVHRVGIKQGTINIKQHPFDLAICDRK